MKSPPAPIHPISALFVRHLPNLDGKALGQYLEYNALPPTVAWTDESGRKWTLLDRLVEHVLAHGAKPANQSALKKLLSDQDTPSATRWHQATPAQKARRTRVLLAAYRVAQVDDGPNVLPDLLPWFKTSFAGKPEGTPAAGFGEAADGGWLALLFDHLDQLRRDHPATFDFSREATAWLVTSLWGRVGERAGHWWPMGGVAGTRVRQQYIGSPGWELPDTLPTDPHILGQANPVRPRLLPAHFSDLASRTVTLIAQGLENRRHFDIQATTQLPEVIASGRLEQWMTPDLIAALRALALAGLTLEPALPHAHARFDGRALEALDALLACCPDDGWADAPTRQALARAVLAHQDAFDHAPQTHVRLIGHTELAPRTHARLWQWAQQALDHSLDSPRRPRP